jgi:hypothetical protein
MYTTIIHDDNGILRMRDWIIRIHLVHKFVDKLVERVHIERIFYD